MSRYFTSGEASLGSTDPTALEMAEVVSTSIDTDQIVAAKDTAIGAPVVRLPTTYAQVRQMFQS